MTILNLLGHGKAVIVRIERMRCAIAVYTLGVAAVSIKFLLGVLGRPILRWIAYYALLRRHIWPGRMICGVGGTKYAKI